MKRLLLILFTAIALFAFSGIPAWAFKTPAKLPVPSIVGNYTDNYGVKQLVQKTRWLIGSDPQPLTFAYRSVDNASKTIVAKNTFNQGVGFNYTGKFSQFNWTQFNNHLWYCQIVFDANTSQEAVNHPPADKTDPSKGGCSAFPWSQLN